jgi:hypothetical protein
MNRLFKKLLGGSMTMSGDLAIRMRSSLEPRLYRLALDHSQKAQEAAKAGDHHREIDEALQAIVMAAACLEAFINAAHLQAGGEPFADTDRTSVVTKWIDVTRNISSGETFDKGTKVFQEMTRLFNDRNYVMHYKAGFEAPVSTPNGQVSAAKAKLTAANAARAVHAMAEGLEEFHRLTGASRPAWLDPDP